MHLPIRYDVYYRICENELVCVCSVRVRATHGCIRMKNILMSVSVYQRISEYCLSVRANQGIEYGVSCGFCTLHIQQVRIQL